MKELNERCKQLNAILLHQKDYYKELIEENEIMKKRENKIKN